MTTETQKTEPTQEQLDAEAADSFAGGFEETASTETGSPADTEGGKGKEGTEAASAAEAPQYVQITQQQLDTLMAAAGKTASYDQQLSKAFGTIGNLQQTINRLKEGNGGFEISDEDFAELQADFPELAGHTRAALERIFKRAKPKGGTDQATTQTDKVATSDDEEAAAAAEAAAAEELDALQPGWRDIVGRPDDADKPFRKWLATQTTAYQNKIRQTQSASDIDRAIEKFNQSPEGKAAAAAAATPAPKPGETEKPATTEPPKPATTTKPAATREAARRDRIEGAIQPRGTGHAPPPQRETEADAFRAGFGSG